MLQLHIPRTGGSALGAAMRAIRKDWRRADHLVRLRDVDDGTPVTVIVRDPVDRFLSLWVFADRHPGPARGELAPIEEFAQDIERHAGALARYRWTMLWNPMTWWLGAADDVRRRGVDVLHTHSLTDDVARRWPKAVLPPTGQAEHPRLSTAAFQAVMAHYAADYQLLEDLSRG